MIHANPQSMDLIAIREEAVGYPGRKKKIYRDVRQDIVITKGETSCYERYS
jgi:hypothetical protein